MYPTIVDFGPVGIHSYGLMLATAFITSVFVIQYELKRRSFVPDVAATIVVSAAIGGIVGAKLYAALLDGRITLTELFSTSGLVWYGGFIGGCLGVLIVVLRSPNPTLATIDIIGPTLLLGYGIGRIGCFLAGDGDYGPPSDLPWAMAFPNGTVPTDVPVHPTPIYETLISFTFFRDSLVAAPQVRGHLRCSVRCESNLVRCGTIFCGVLANHATRIGMG